MIHSENASKVILVEYLGISRAYGTGLFSYTYSKLGSGHKSVIYFVRTTALSRWSSSRILPIYLLVPRQHYIHGCIMKLGSNRSFGNET